jgi:hypothetical protein
MLHVLTDPEILLLNPYKMNFFDVHEIWYWKENRSIPFLCLCMMYVYLKKKDVIIPQKSDSGVSVERRTIAIELR